MTSIKLSVIIPCYNGQDVIDEALLSLLNQDMVKAGTVEVIVIDDGSTDRTSEILARYANVSRMHRLSAMAAGENSRLMGLYGANRAYANRRTPCRWRDER